MPKLITPKPPKIGRPDKPDKFTAAMSFPCHPDDVQAVERLRVAGGMRSRGDVLRGLIRDAIQKIR